MVCKTLRSNRADRGEDEILPCGKGKWSSQLHLHFIKIEREPGARTQRSVALKGGKDKEGLGWGPESGGIVHRGIQIDKASYICI